MGATPHPHQAAQFDCIRQVWQSLILNVRGLETPPSLQYEQ